LTGKRWREVVLSPKFQLQLVMLPPERSVKETRERREARHGPGRELGRGRGPLHDDEAVWVRRRGPAGPLTT
jgi:hypothetical protein